MTQAKDCERQLQDLLTRLKSGSVNGSSGSTTPTSELLDKAKAIQVVLADVIQGSDDPSKLEELFMLNDNITSLMLKVEDAQRAPVLNGLGIFTPLIPEVSLQSTTFYWRVVTQSFLLFYLDRLQRETRGRTAL